MKTINIAGAIDELLIFDDPEYCDKNMKECPFLKYYDKAWCELFKCSMQDSNRPHKGTEKCPQCKSAYQKALNKTK